MKLLTALVMSICCMFARTRSEEVEVGELVKSEEDFSISGTVFITGEYSLKIKRFYYTGLENRNGFFYVGFTRNDPSPSGGVLVPLPDDNKHGLKNMMGAEIQLQLSVKTSSIRWLSIWSQRDSINLAHVRFPYDIGELQHTSFDVSGRVSVKNESLIIIKNFRFNGKDRQSFFLAGVYEDEPNSNGKIIPYQDNALHPLDVFNGQQVNLTLTGIRASQIKWLAVWSHGLGKSLGSVFFNSASKATTATYAAVILLSLQLLVSRLMRIVN